MNTSLVIAPKLALAADWCKISPDAIAQKEAALAAPSLIGKVSTKAENDAAGHALGVLQSLSRRLERQRKEITDPFVEAQRTAKRVVDEFKDEIELEAARIEGLMKVFALEEQRRAREEAEAQQREIERIEREKQAELRRIADEQARIEREAREAQEAAERAASEAKNKAQREAAAKLQAEALELARAAAVSIATTTQQVQLVNERADLLTRIESKPIETARSAGQSNRKKWKITQINDFQLCKARPDLVRKIEWDKIAITEILNAGGTLPGVTAEEDIGITVRQKAVRTIEV